MPQSGSLENSKYKINPTDGQWGLFEQIANSEATYLNKFSDSKQATVTELLDFKQPLEPVCTNGEML